MKEYKIKRYETHKIICEDSEIEVNIKVKRNNEIEIQVPDGNILIRTEYSNQISIINERWNK